MTKMLSHALAPASSSLQNLALPFMFSHTITLYHMHLHVLTCPCMVLMPSHIFACPQIQFHGLTWPCMASHTLAFPPKLLYVLTCPHTSLNALACSPMPCHALIHPCKPLHREVMPRAERAGRIRGGRGGPGNRAALLGRERAYPTTQALLPPQPETS